MDFFYETCRCLVTGESRKESRTSKRRTKLQRGRRKTYKTSATAAANGYHRNEIADMTEERRSATKSKSPEPLENDAFDFKDTPDDTPEGERGLTKSNRTGAAKEDKDQPIEANNRQATTATAVTTKDNSNLHADSKKADAVPESSSWEEGEAERSGGLNGRSSVSEAHNSESGGLDLPSNAQHPDPIAKQNEPETKLKSVPAKPLSPAPIDIFASMDSCVDMPKTTWAPIAVSRAAKKRLRNSRGKNTLAPLHYLESANFADKECLMVREEKYGAAAEARKSAMNTHTAHLAEDLSDSEVVDKKEVAQPDDVDLHNVGPDKSVRWEGDRMVVETFDSKDDPVPSGFELVWAIGTEEDYGTNDEFDFFSDDDDDCLSHDLLSDDEEVTNQAQKTSTDLVAVRTLRSGRTLQCPTAPTSKSCGDVEDSDADDEASQPENSGTVKRKRGQDDSSKRAKWQRREIKKRLAALQAEMEELQAELAAGTKGGNDERNKKQLPATEHPKKDCDKLVCERSESEESDFVCESDESDESCVEPKRKRYRATTKKDQHPTLVPLRVQESLPNNDGLLSGEEWMSEDDLESDVECPGGWKIRLKKKAPNRRIKQPKRISRPGKGKGEGKDGKGRGKKQKRKVNQLPQRKVDVWDKTSRDKVDILHKCVKTAQNAVMPLVMHDNYEPPDNLEEEDPTRRAERLWPKNIVGVFTCTEQVANYNCGNGDSGNWRRFPQLNMFAGSKPAAAHLKEAINSNNTRWRCFSAWDPFVENITTKTNESN